MRYFIFLTFLFVASPVFALTDIILTDPTNITSYELNMMYDSSKNTLSPSLASSSQYQIVREIFTASPKAFQSEFLGLLVGPKEKEYQRFGIPLPEEVITGSIQSYGVSAPYHPSGERIDVYKGGTKLFSIDISASRICVEDGRCEGDAGENDLNCSVDCRDTPPPQGNLVSESGGPILPPITPGALPPQGSKAIDETPSEGLSSMVLSVIFLILGLLSFGVWAYLRKRSQG